MPHAFLFPTKNLGTLGDGGIITTSDLDLAKQIRKLRTHGTTKSISMTPLVIIVDLMKYMPQFY